MRRLAGSVVLVLLLALPALADTDTFARSKLNAQDKRIESLEAQVRALTVLVGNLKEQNGELQRKVDTNLTLIKGLASALPAPVQTAP